jgi:hypothetical protein
MTEALKAPMKSPALATMQGGNGAQTKLRPSRGARNQGLRVSKTLSGRFAAARYNLKDKETAMRYRHEPCQLLFL